MPSDHRANANASHRDRRVSRNMNEKAPLFKYERDNSRRTSSIWLAGAVLSAIVAILYVLGILLPSAILTGLALGLGGIGAIVLIFMFVWVHGAKGTLTEDEIDHAVEQYKHDLTDTLIGYDLSYSAYDINTAAHQYRLELEHENRALSDTDGNFLTLVKSAISDISDKRQSSHREKKQDRKLRRDAKLERKNKKNKKKNEQGLDGK